jgi:copper chaperone CopZ
MELNDMEGISNVVADMDGKQATVTFDPPATEDGIKQLLTEINYPVAG